MFSGLSLVIAIGLGGQGRPFTITSQQLSPSKRPILTVPGLNGKDIFSVSRYTNKETPYPAFVYRYVYRGDYEAVLKEFKSRLTKEDGWVFEMLEPAPKVPCLSRVLKHGPVQMQGLIFHPNRLIPDEFGGHRAKGDDNKAGYG